MGKKGKHSVEREKKHGIKVWMLILIIIIFATIFFVRDNFDIISEKWSLLLQKVDISNIPNIGSTKDKTNEQQTNNGKDEQVEKEKNEDQGTQGQQQNMQGNQETHTSGQQQNVQGNQTEQTTDIIIHGVSQNERYSGPVNISFENSKSITQVIITDGDKKEIVNQKNGEPITVSKVGLYTISVSNVYGNTMAFKFVIINK